MTLDRRMSGRMALASLIAGYMNDHLFHPECGWAHGVPVEEWERGDCEGCCPLCCGPCSAMVYFRDVEDAYVTKILSGYMPGADYIWQRSDGGIDWVKVQWHWDNLEPARCHGEGICT